MDQLLHDIISAMLRKFPPFRAKSKNVLCNGFSLATDYGHASVLRNLDLTASSAPMQFLRSPIWNRIFECVGHVICRHILANGVLLLAIAENSNPPKQLESLASVFLQICGPAPITLTAHNKFYISDKPLPLFLKRQLMYITPTHKEKESKQGNSRISRSSQNVNFVTSSHAVNGSTAWQHENRKEANIREATRNMRNEVSICDGMPKSHHIQSMRGDRNSARQLLTIIFHQKEKPRPPEKRGHEKLGMSDHTKKQNPTDSYRRIPINYDEIGRDLNNSTENTNRGCRWLASRKRSFKRYRTLEPILEKVIARMKHYKLRRLLGVICPLPKEFDRSGKKNGNSKEVLVDMKTAPKDVALFITACLRKLFPKNFFGSLRNREVIEKGVHELIRRRMKQESFDVSRFVSHNGFKVSDVEWLCRSKSDGRRVVNPTDLEFRKKSIQALCLWLFHSIVLSLVQHSFYTTDSNLQRNRILFFRREVWTKLLDAAHDDILRANKRFRILSKDELYKCVITRENNLISLGKALCPFPVFVHNALRFFPKRTSLRPIQTVHGKLLHGFSSPNSGMVITKRWVPNQGSGAVKKAISLTRKLYRHILRILQAEGANNPDVLGASIFSLNDIYTRFAALKAKWVEMKRPKMYVCSVDISSSFDTIPLGTLLSKVIPPLLTKERYILIRYAMSKPDIATGKVKQRTMLHACQSPGDETSFSKLIREKLCAKHPGAIYTDLAQEMVLTRDQILLALNAFLGNNVVSIRKRNRSGLETGYAQQYHGVPQGNELSPLLASLFYAHIEKEDLSKFLPTRTLLPHPNFSTHGNDNEAEIGLLMRQVDDTIFLTSSQEKANRFMRRTQTGWSSTHGFRVNADKTKSSFPCPTSPGTSRYIHWVGLVIDSQTMEISADYSRYSNNGGRLRDAISVDFDTKAGEAFAERAWACYMPKLHPLLLDFNINTRATVGKNVYQAALLVILKMSSCATALMPSSTHLMSIVEAMLDKFVHLISRVVSSRFARSNACQFRFSRGELKYLTAHAFLSGITRRLRQRRKMKDRVQKSVEYLQRVLDFKERNEKQHFSVVKLAEHISTNLCKTLWEIKL